ncbi:DUF6599 family protein [uncultured Dysgonomonas sp.]|uniref:Uncharacterized protein n=1 Tax=uncultured Dysgonomonas sp. TaxID=206096 RepID=A0A212IWA5_9BACT|nr:DUF6599 family protein [uncultured Dysgonomonas sp.]SBV91467.1 conserved exported hypothetical protein [uncultured Dysgonomonas sp.]
MKIFKYTIILFYCAVYSVSAQTPAELKSWLPAIEGWAISDKIEIFEPDNLFDRINGAAPLYLENNFREMTQMEYTRGDDYISIQAYRHASPEDAFGMYASERSSELKFFPIGGEAQGDNSGIFFFAGNIYVKMWSSAQENVSETMRAIATHLAGSIDATAGYPPVVNAFPKENMIPHTEAYVTANYIGHTFLNMVYTAKYKIDSETCQAFVVDAKSADGAKDILNKYFAFTKQPLDFVEGNLIIKDRYNGDIPAIWKGQYIIGVFSENGDKIAGADIILGKISEVL